MTSEHFDVLIVGAGLSGIGAGFHLQQKCPEKSYVILEGRDCIGGTWDLFRYPGIRSDSDMFTLGYSFKPWTEAKAIADGPRILNYVRETAAENGIDKQIGLECFGVPGEIFRRVDYVEVSPRGARLQFAPCRGGVAFELGGRAQQQHGHFKAGFSKQARRHQAIAAVVAAAADHRHPPHLLKMPSREAGHGCRGRPHEIERRDSESFASQAVAGLHLGCRKNVHGNHVSARAYGMMSTRPPARENLFAAARSSSSSLRFCQARPP